MEIGGTYPMLYAFFDEAGRLRRDAVSRQIEAADRQRRLGNRRARASAPRCTSSAATERRTLVEWTIADVAGRLPVAVTVADGNVPDMIDSARFARDAGAAWLILQPPRPPASGAHLIKFFGAVADARRLPGRHPERARIPRHRPVAGGSAWRSTPRIPTSRWSRPRAPR